jgi:hypothetical protein
VARSLSVPFDGHHTVADDTIATAIQNDALSGGSATVVNTDPVNWLVIAGSGKSLSFTSAKGH